jgi:hypothetical protein
VVLLFFFQVSDFRPSGNNKQKMNCLRYCVTRPAINRNGSWLVRKSCRANPRAIQSLNLNNRAINGQSPNFFNSFHRYSTEPAAGAAASPEDYHNIITDGEKATGVPESQEFQAESPETKM